MYPDGLRERKKQQTRLALVDAALDLFIEQGYDHTTVDQIAAAVDVSPRTFFRYFASKEDILLHHMEEAERVITAELASRPADEPPFVAMAQAYRAVLRYIEASTPDENDRFLRTQRVLDGNPALMVTNFTRVTAMEERLAIEVGRRMGADTATDRRPSLVVALISAAARVGFMCPHSDVTETGAITKQVEQVIALAEEVLRPDWPTGSRAP
jgi:AcrR family transcriptional regulator